MKRGSWLKLRLLVCCAGLLPITLIVHQIVLKYDVAGPPREIILTYSLVVTQIT